jgi:hypothetical protein
VSSTILMVIVLVVMWLVVLVPMFVRKHDEGDEERSVDRFATAMRVLRRRTEAEDPVPHPVPPARARAGARARLLARRRRICAGLLLLAVVGVGGALLLSRWLWIAAVVGAVLLVAYVGGLRQQVRRTHARRHPGQPAGAPRLDRADRADRADRSDRSDRSGRADRSDRAGRAGQGDRAARIAQARALLAGRAHTVRTGRGAAATHTSRPDAAQAAGQPALAGQRAGTGWEPVPVPVPTYVTKAAVAGASGATVVGLDDDDPIFAEIQEAEIAERPRAVND